MARHAHHLISPLKIMSWNIQEGGDDRLDAIAVVMRANKPDCLALLEADSLSNAEALASELGMTLSYGAANCPSAVAWVDGPDTGQCREPSASATGQDAAGDRTGVERRTAATVCNPPRITLEIQQPLDEVVTILEVLDQRGGDCHVLAGDLNALRPGDPIGTPPPGESLRGDAADDAARLTIRRILDARYVDCFRHIHPRRRGFTYPSEAAWLPFDYIFALTGIDTLPRHVRHH